MRGPAAALRRFQRSSTAPGFVSLRPVSHRPALRRNHGRYLGERLEVDHVQRQLLAAANRHGWRAEVFLDQPDRQLHAFHRPAPGARRKIYLSSGVHGDEPAGPLALLELLAANHWPADTELWLCPCLNPSGLRASTRENAEGHDLNRDYRHRRTPEVRAHVALLDRLPPLDLAICLHEDWEARGFYLYELNATGGASHAQRIIAQVAPVCPIDPSPEIDGRPARGGIIRPEADPTKRPDWPEAFYLFQHKTRLSYTFESPSDFDLEVRVRAQVAAVRAALEQASSAGKKVAAGA